MRGAPQPTASYTFALMGKSACRLTRCTDNSNKRKEDYEASLDCAYRCFSCGLGWSLDLLLLLLLLSLSLAIAAAAAVAVAVAVAVVVARACHDGRSLRCFCLFGMSSCVHACGIFFYQLRFRVLRRHVACRHCSRRRRSAQPAAFLGGSG